MLYEQTGFYVFLKCMHVCMYVCTYIHVYIYIFVPTNTYLQKKISISHLLRWELVVKVETTGR